MYIIMKTKHFYSILFALLLLSFVSQAQSYYLYFPGITIKKGIKGHDDEVFLTSITNGIFKLPASGNPDFSNYSFTKSYDVTSVDILKYLTSATVTDGVEIRVYSTASAPATLIIQLKGVAITNVSMAGASQEPACTTCTGISESIELSFTAIKIGTFMWNRSGNTPTF